MKVISLLEPWASLVKERVKYVETRSFKTNYRGELYIHASKRVLSKTDLIRYEKQISLLEKPHFQYGFVITNVN